jgi:hypothetical protein
MRKKPPSRERDAQISRLWAITGASELMSTMLETTLLATALGINAALPAQTRASNETVRKLVRSQLPQVLKETERNVRDSMHFSYRALSDRDLEAYLQYLESASGAAYTRHSLAALREGITEATARYMQAIPKALSQVGNATGT